MQEKIVAFFKNTFERRDARIIAVIIILALIAGIVVATTRGGSSDEANFDGLSPVSDYVFQPNNALGPDPFGPSFANYTLEVPTEDLSSGTVSSDTSGLYGGTGENSCDVEAMIEFLMNNPDRAAAWAGVQGIAVDEIPDYLRSLTAVVLLENTLVINHGYSEGEAVPFLAVLEAGTAVLVDDDGIPRVRCACGNPLTPPEEPPPTEETTTTEPEITTEEVDCPIFDGEPPYGFTLETDGTSYGYWSLHTPGGIFVWDQTLPGWHPVPDDGTVYATESDIPGYDEECWPCPPSTPGGRSTPSYETDDDGGYKSSSDVLEEEGKERTEKYVVIKAVKSSSGTTTTKDSGADDDPEVYEPSFDTEEIDPETTEEFEPEYDDESTFDGCLPPCIDWRFGVASMTTRDYHWIWPGQSFEYTYPAEDSPDHWSWEHGVGWVNPLYVPDTVITDFRDLPGWFEECNDCPPWGWVETDDGVWRWIDPSGEFFTFDADEDGWVHTGNTDWGDFSDPYQQTTEIDSSDADWLGVIDDYAALPGFDEECFDCPNGGAGKLALI